MNLLGKPEKAKCSAFSHCEQKDLLQRLGSKHRLKTKSLLPNFKQDIEDFAQQENVALDKGKRVNTDNNGSTYKYDF